MLEGESMRLVRVYKRVSTHNDVVKNGKEDLFNRAYVYIESLKHRVQSLKICLEIVRQVCKLTERFCDEPLSI